MNNKINKEKLINESSLNKKIKTLARKEEIKTLATKAELKAVRNKLVKLKMDDLSYLRGKYFYGDDGSQNILVYQPTLPIRHTTSQRRLIQFRK